MQGTRTLISILALAGATACASGPPGPPGGGPPGESPGGRPGGSLQEARIARPIAILFTGMDANRNLVLEKSELEVAIPQEFTRADVDGSGVLTGFEMADWCRLMLGDKEAQPDMRAMDTDINYTVTQQEFATALRHEFERMDKDENGMLTRVELLMDAPRNMMQHDGGQGAPPGSGRRGGGPTGGRGPGGGPQGGGAPPF